MSEEKVVSTDVSINPLDMLNDGIEPAAPVEMPVVSGNFVPNLNICYSVSKSFTDGIAKPGDFVLAGQTSLGTEVDAIVLDYRIHAALIKDKAENCGNAFHSAHDQRNISADPEYQKFITQSLMAGYEMVVGTDLFMYLPDQNAFVVMYYKKSLSKFAPKIHDAGRGGRVLKLGTSYREYKTAKWYDITITPTGRAVEGSALEVNGVELEKNVSIPKDKFNEYYKIFNNPDGAVETTEGEKRDR